MIYQTWQQHQDYIDLYINFDKYLESTFKSFMIDV